MWRAALGNTLFQTPSYFNKDFAQWEADLGNTLLQKNYAQWEAVLWTLKLMGCWAAHLALHCDQAPLLNRGLV